MCYVEYIWDDNRRDEWFNLSHTQRLRRLSLNSMVSPLAEITPLLLIYLYYEENNYDNIRVTETFKGAQVIYFNGSGYCYAAQMNMFNMYMTHYEPDEEGDRPFWHESKTKVDHFRRRSAEEIMKSLHAIYDRAHIDHIYSVREMDRKMMNAWFRWATANTDRLKLDNLWNMPWLARVIVAKDQTGSILADEQKSIRPPSDLVCQAEV